MKISFSLSEKSISDAIKRIEQYEKWISEKTELLSEKLAEAGMKEARIRFEAAAPGEVKTSVEKTQNGWKIVASGDSVCFIEFGAGIHYNSDGDYPLKKPQGVVGIGEYGQGKGKQNAWGYYDEGHNLIITHGTPAAMPMYFAGKEMEQKISQIAKEVFG